MQRLLMVFVKSKAHLRKGIMSNLVPSERSSYRIVALREFDQPEQRVYLLLASVDDIISTMQATWQSHMIRTHMIGWKESGGGHMENTKN